MWSSFRPRLSTRRCEDHDEIKQIVVGVDGSESSRALGGLYDEAAQHDAPSSRLDLHPPACR